jgi:hypothetical protein
MRKLLYVFLIIFIAVALVLGIKVSKKDPILPTSKDYDYMTCEGTLDNPDELPLLQKDNLSVTLLNVFTNTLKEEDLKSLNLTEVEINNVMIQADNDNFIALVKFESLDGTSVNELSCDFQIYDKSTKLLLWVDEEGNTLNDFTENELLEDAEIENNIKPLIKRAYTSSAICVVC